MPFRNKIRLPFYVTRPQFPTESNTFRLANGTRRTLSSVIRKTFEGETENLPREIHERLVIALKHDDVTIEGKYYLGGISLDGDYDIDWNKFLDFPLAKAAFKIDVTPFNYSNNNCQTCEELSQVVCEDDDLGTVDEDDTITVPVLANDSICCSPVVISLVTYNSDFLDSCIISGNDIIIHLKQSLPDANSVILVTYRAQCPSGAYDEANIIANINGTDPTPICVAPTDPVLVSLDSDTSATFSWTPPSPVPDCGYHWEVKNFTGLITLASGDTSSTSVQVTGLPSGQALCQFFVQSNCCSENTNYAGPVLFSLPPPSDTQTCGQYFIENWDFTEPHFVTYIDCNGDAQESHIIPGGYRYICALQNSPGDPVQITPSHFDINITYIDLC
jgi:hypothetical protein